MEFADNQLVTIQPWAWKQIKALISVVEMLAAHASKEMEKILGENS